MGCNLIAITSDRFSDDLVDQAIADCISGKKTLIVLLINDPANIDKTALMFKHTSPVGNGKQIAESLKKHNDYLLGQDLASIEEKAMNAQVGYEEIKVSGEFVEKVLETVESRKPETLFVCRMNTKTSFERFLQGSAVETLQKSCSCNVVII